MFKLNESMKVKFLIKQEKAGALPTVFEKEAAMCVIGRQDADLELSDARCSKQHAVLFQSPDGRLALRDLGSTNGTLINGKKVMEATLGVGDRIGIGSFVLSLLQFEPNSAKSAKPKTQKSKPGATGSYNASEGSKTDVLVEGPEKIFQCLPKDVQNSFVNFVDESGVEVRTSLNDLLKMRKS